MSAEVHCSFCCSWNIHRSKVWFYSTL